MRRILRIFPLYFLFLCLFFIVIPLIAGKTFINHNQYYFDNQWWFWAYLQNWLYAINEGYGQNRVLIHLWSLAIEEQFYLVWPLFVWLLSGKQLLKFSIFTIALSILARIAYFAYGYSWTATDTTITRLDALCIGAIVAILIRDHNLKLWLEKYSRLLFKISLPVVLLLLVFDHSWFRPEGAITRTIGFTIIAIMFAALLVISLSGNPKSFAIRFFSSNFLTFFGKYSYSMYIFHFPLVFYFVPQVRNFINRFEGSGITSFFVSGILGIIITVLISLLTRYIIEKPILGLKKYFVPQNDAPYKPTTSVKRGFLISLVIIMLIFFIGLSFVYTHKPKPVKCNSPFITENLNCIANKNLVKHKAHGLGYCIILPGDSIIKGSVGVARNNIPVKDSMQWMFASCTKTFIAAVALQLQEEGRWSLNDKVGKYFTHPSLDSNNTIRQLLNHTSSVTNAKSEKYFKALFLKTDSIWQPLDVLNYYNTRPDKSKEGTFHYTNANYLILGLLIEKVTGNTLTSELESRIFKKYGLHQTLFVTSNYDAKNMAGAWYDINKEGMAEDIFLHYSKQTQYPLNSTLSLGYGSANIVSTTVDMARWTKLLYSGKVLKKESLNEMLTWANGSNRDKYFKGYGLGTDLLMLHGLKNYGHTGLGVHTSGVFYTPDLDLTIVLVTNEQSSVERDTKIEMFDYLLEYLEKR